MGDTQAWPDDRARSLCIEEISAAIRDDVALLVLASRVTLSEFERSNPGIVRALAARAADAAANYLHTGRMPYADRAQRGDLNG